MGLRLALSEGESFFIDGLKIELVHCENVGRLTAKATFRVCQEVGAYSKEIEYGEKLEVIPNVLIEIWIKGSLKKNRLQIIVSAPESVIIRREGYEIEGRPKGT